MCKLIKRLFGWLNSKAKKYQHWTDWIIAISILIPVLYGFSLYISGQLGTLFEQGNQYYNSTVQYYNYQTCSRPIHASCVCDYKDKNGYLNFREQKCRNLSIEKSINLTTEEISQVSQYFILLQDSEITRFTITKNANMSCDESASCLYSASFSQGITVHG